LVLLETLVVIGKKLSKPVQAENDCVGKSREREGQERVKGIAPRHPGLK
jgi:hypothetical protein